MTSARARCALGSGRAGVVAALLMGTLPLRHTALVLWFVSSLLYQRASGLPRQYWNARRGGLVLNRRSGSSYSRLWGLYLRVGADNIRFYTIRSGVPKTANPIRQEI